MNCGFSIFQFTFPDDQDHVHKPDLPPMMWTRLSLEFIVSKRSRSIKIDQPTNPLTKGRFTHLVIELNVRCPSCPQLTTLLRTLIVLFLHVFKYEHIHLFYHRCSCVEHWSVFCTSPPPNPFLLLPLPWHLRQLSWHSIGLTLRW